jgi:hypothetical protein
MSLSALPSRAINRLQRALNQENLSTHRSAIAKIATEYFYEDEILQRAWQAHVSWTLRSMN